MIVLRGGADLRRNFAPATAGIRNSGMKKWPRNIVVGAQLVINFKALMDDEQEYYARVGMGIGRNGRRR
jgi:hypothetical protein